MIGKAKTGVFISNYIRDI